MAVNQRSFTIELDSVVLHKFQTLISDASPDLNDVIDITPQVGEVSMYQSIFLPTMKAEISIHDEIGLFVNFPLTGDEAVSVTYIQKDSVTGQEQTVKRYFVIDTVSAITPQSSLRSVDFLMTCISFEAYFGARTRVSHSYNSKPSNIISDIVDEYINTEIKKIYPTYPIKTITYQHTGQLVDKALVVPNFRPFKAINWVSRQAVSMDEKMHSYVFYENFSGFQFKSVQGILHDPDERERALKEDYRYISNEITSSTMKNEGRIATNLTFNRRLSSFAKIMAGYYENTLFEVNMAQKAYWMKKTTNEDINTIEPNSLNRSVFELFTRVAQGGADDPMAEDANKVRYIVNNWRENDAQYQNPLYRDRWGPGISSSIAMSQVDITLVVPGNSMLQAGSLFHLTIPEMHGFNVNNPDDLLTGYFLITEVKHIMTVGGRHSTTLTINKDSYATSVDRNSRYTSNGQQ